MNIDVRDICVQLANGPEGGIGLRKSVNIPLTAPTLGGTGPAVTNSSGVQILTLGNSDNVATFAFPVPIDYDQRAYNSNDTWKGDRITVRIFAQATTTTTNTLEIDDVKIWSLAGTAVEDPTLPTGASAQTISASAFTFYDYDLTNLGLVPGDVVSIQIGCTIAGNNVLVRGIQVLYPGRIEATDRSNR